MAPLSLDDFDFDLPPELIAQHPAVERDLSRLLVVDRRTGVMAHRRFRDLVDLLDPGDLLVINDTKVLPARLYGTRATGARLEVLLLEELGPDRWLCMVRPGRKAPEGTEIRFDETFSGVIGDVHLDGTRAITLRASGEVREAIARHGELPLPPYITAKPADPGRYQTVFADQEGAVAAPTAGLHFTPQLLEALKAKGVGTATVTLHVGLGTFKPVTEVDPTRHVMHAERYELGAETVEAIARTHAAGHRVVAVGTTVVRTLEHAAASGSLGPSRGETRLFIYPGFRFRVVDALITNFHLPRSTLLMLVAAFAERGMPEGGSGRDLVLRVYGEAIAQGYRFYSFGDATLWL